MNYDGIEKLNFTRAFQVLSVWTRPRLGLESSLSAEELARVDLDFFPLKVKGLQGSLKRKVRKENFKYR